MRTYIITLSHIPSVEADEKFVSFINENKLDWSRYVPNVWLLVTPDNISTNFLATKIAQSYGMLYCSILQIEIKDVGGFFPMSQEQKDNLPPGWTPFKLLTDLRDKNFVPRWEREKENK